MNANASLAVPLRPAVSIGLDAGRFLAALAVFLGHLGLRRFSDGALWHFHPYGDQAVTFFFVLSGFVIAHVHATRERDARRYAISRLARLYSVVVPALLLTVALDAAGRALNPAAYTAAWGFVPATEGWRLPAALLFLHEAWGVHLQPGSNAAYWSLGYEAPYYLGFGLAVFLRGWVRVAALAALALLVGPGILASAPVWLAGVAAYHALPRLRWSARQGLGAMGLALTGWLLYEAVVAHTGRPLLAWEEVLFRRFVFQDLVLAPLMALALLGLHAAAPLLDAPLQRCERPVRALAGLTFTLYLCHEPLAQFLTAVSPWPVGDVRCTALLLVGTLATMPLLAAVGEHRKGLWRRGLERWWPERPAPTEPATEAPIDPPAEPAVRAVRPPPAQP